jgi:hypothetical protein
MGNYFRHLAAVAALVCLALVATGCGDDATVPAGKGATTATPAQIADAAAAEKAADKANMEKNLPPDVKAKREALIKKAKAEKAAAIKAGTTTPPEGRSDVKCRDAKGYTHISTVGFDCAIATKFLVAGDTRWAALSSNGTKVKGYDCARVGTDQKALHFYCTNVGGSISFRLPTG